jgi:gamma-glutamyltranspeptidase / glutathione hydrolase
VISCRFLVRLLLAALLAGFLFSCSAEPTTPENSARGDTAGPEASVREETTAGGNAGRETAEPTRESAAEPEFAEGPASRNTAQEPAVGTNGMVAAAHPLATRAGLEILESGGNAFDAAIAVSAALNVVEPEMSGVGGYGAIVVYDAGEGETRFLEIGSRVPAAVDPSIFRPPNPDYLENRCGAPVVAVPGNLRAWETLSEEYGELEWQRLFGPAVRYADEGFVVGEELAGWLGSEYSAFPANAQEIYGRGGEPLGVGDRLVQADLADSLRLIAEEGAGTFYGGELGDAVVSEVQERGGFLTEADLHDNRATWHETVSIEHQGREVVTAAPPATSWGALARLGIMGQFDLGPSDHNGVSYVHAMTEISKRAFYQSSRYVDAETGQVRLDRVLSPEYWAEEAASIDFSRASPYDPPVEVDTALSCSPTNYTPAEVADAGRGGETASVADLQQHTTHFVVADREGNVVSSTQTLGNVFGSKVMPEGTGIWLNDEVAWARFEPAGNPFDAVPGRQIPYALSPTIVMRDGRPTMALGTPGGRTILQTTPQMIMNVTEFDMDIQEAVTSPRFSFVIPDLLLVEEGVPAEVREELLAMGHNLYVEPELGNAQALTIEYGQGGEPVRFAGAADPRGEGSAMGF